MNFPPATPSITAPLAALLLIGFALTASHAQSDSPQDTQPAAPPSPQVVEWLDKLEARGKQIQSLQANVTYTKINPLLSDRQTRIGKIDYLAADPAHEQPARFAVLFEQLIVNDSLRDQQLGWVFDGTWLAEKQFDRKLFLKRQVVPPGETFDPLRIGGPFPLPLGQKSEEVLARFDVQIVPPDPPQPSQESDEPPLHLRLTPRPDAPEAEAEARGSTRERFEHIDLWFDRETLLPRKVRTVDDAGQETIVTLANATTNELSKQDAAERFDTTPPPGWDVEITPWQEPGTR